MDTRLFRFFQEAREIVFGFVEFTRSPTNPLNFGFPKISTQRETGILSKLFQNPNLAAQLSRTAIKPVLVHRIAHYYIKCFDFVPYFRSDRDGVKKSEDYKEYRFVGNPKQFVAVINSTTFYFYWQVFFDAFKAGKLCIESFPLGLVRKKSVANALTCVATDLMRDLKAQSTRLKAQYSATGRVEYDQFYPRRSKAIIDDIDATLAGHYGFTEEELDFIINYDIKYRMGLSDGSAGDTEE